MQPRRHIARLLVQRWRCAAGRFALLAVASCGSLRLSPLTPVPGTDARARGAGVEVRAAGDSPRPSAVPGSFTPLKIAVHNLGAHALYVDLGDVQLSSGALALRAVAPADIPPRRRVASLGMDPSSPFMARQTVGALGPRNSRTETVLLEPRYGSVVGSPYGLDDPARAEILSSAFQAGVILAGETHEGLVYFRQVPADAVRLTLRVGIRPSAGHAPISVVEIAYVVRS